MNLGVTIVGNLLHTMIHPSIQFLAVNFWLFFALEYVIFRPAGSSSSFHSMEIENCGKHVPIVFQSFQYQNFAGCLRSGIVVGCAALRCALHYRACVSMIGSIMSATSNWQYHYE